MTDSLLYLVFFFLTIPTLSLRPNQLRFLYFPFPFFSFAALRFPTEEEINTILYLTLCVRSSQENTYDLKPSIKRGERMGGKDEKTSKEGLVCFGF